MTAVPVREPVFTETMQIGIVARDLEGTMRRYVDDFGIGPWEIFEFNAGKAEDFHENGVILSGKFGGGTVAYLGTDRDLGVVLEIFSGTQEDSE